MIVSVIIPVYNSESYIDKCIQSVINQTYKDLDIIVIDDGSTDSSKEKIMLFQKADSRIRYYFQKNSGQAVARNNGISLARGEVVIFLDSDDWIDSCMIFEMARVYEQNKGIIVSCGINFIDDNGNVVREKGFSVQELSGQELIIDALLVKNFFSSACNKMVPLVLLKNYNIQFPGIRSNEDILFNLVLSVYAPKCVFINKNYYKALIREKSTSRTVSIQMIEDTALLFVMERELLTNNSQINELIEHYYFHCIKTLLFLLLRNEKYSGTNVKLVRRKIMKEIEYYCNDGKKYLPYFIRVVCAMVKIEKLLSFLVKLYKVY
jgi:glycosyltransferase involved in cell wall biosynthesis